MVQRSEPRTATPTHREQELINLVTRGLQNKEIAYAMKISENTVKAHIANILRKYNLHNRTQIAIAFAIQARSAISATLHPGTTEALHPGATEMPHEHGNARTLRLTSG